MMYLEDQDVYIVNGEDMREMKSAHKETKHALWMARAKICELERLTTLRREWEWTEGALNALENAERKCLAKAEEYK